MTDKFIEKQIDLKISKAVEKAEKKTSAEIVTIIKDKSSSYQIYTIMASFTMVTILTFILSIFFDKNSILYYFGLDNFKIFWVLLFQLAASAIFYNIFNLKKIKQFIIDKETKQITAEKEAFLNFITEGVDDTKNRTGVLIFISQFEHFAAIITDNGISAKIPNETWETHVKILTEYLKKKELEKGVLTIIEKITSILEKNFPRKVGDKNEKPNTPKRKKHKK